MQKRKKLPFLAIAFLNYDLFNNHIPALKYPAKVSRHLSMPQFY